MREEAAKDTGRVGDARHAAVVFRGVCRVLLILVQRGPGVNLAAADPFPLHRARHVGRLACRVHQGCWDRAGRGDRRGGRGRGQRRTRGGGRGGRGHRNRGHRAQWRGKDGVRAGAHHRCGSRGRRGVAGHGLGATCYCCGVGRCRCSVCRGRRHCRRCINDCEAVNRGGLHPLRPRCRPQSER